MITLNTDSILQHDSLLHINQEFNVSDVIGAGGMVQVGQMYNKAGKPVFKGKPLIKYQLSEYLMSFYVRRFAQSKMKMIAIVSSAFGAFSREVLHEIGGYKKKLGEDITSYWSATRYKHNYRWFDYLRVITFFILEMPIRPILDMSFYVSGTFAYVFGKNKHNWNKVKRLGNVEVIHQKSA